MKQKLTDRVLETNDINWHVTLLMIYNCDSLMIHSKIFLMILKYYGHDIGKSVPHIVTFQIWHKSREECFYCWWSGTLSLSEIQLFIECAANPLSCTVYYHSFYISRDLLLQFKRFRIHSNQWCQKKSDWDVFFCLQSKWKIIYGEHMTLSFT
jgi:hypothetical protein